MPAEKMRVEAARTGIGFYLKAFFFFPGRILFKVEGHCWELQIYSKVTSRNLG